MGGRRALSRVKRLVVKVGSGLITAPGQGPDSKRIGALAADLAAVIADRREVALVSSGAIVTGMARRAMEDGVLAEAERLSSDFDDVAKLASQISDAQS